MKIRQPPARRRRATGILAGLLGLLLVLLLTAAVKAFYAPPGAPLATLTRGSVSTTIASTDRASLLFVGDTAFGETYLAGSPEEAVLRDGYAPAYARVKPLTDAANLVIANLETPLTHRRDSPLRWVKPWVHWGDPARTIEALTALHVGAVTLANNHTYDQLGGGLDDTLAVLVAHHIASFGAGDSLRDAARPFRQDVIVLAHTVRVAVVGTFLPEWLDLLYDPIAGPRARGAYRLMKRTITEQVRALRRADPSLFLVVSPHWGDNYAWRSGAQTELAHAMIDAGADMVIGHGAHEFQEVEAYARHWIVYGLGNFLFLSPGRWTIDGAHPYSLAARLDFVARAGDGLSLTLRLYFLASDNGATHFQPFVLDGAEFDKAVRVLLARGERDGEANDALVRAAVRDRDAVGPHLRLELGRVDIEAPHEQ